MAMMLLDQLFDKLVNFKNELFSDIPVEFVLVGTITIAAIVLGVIVVVNRRNTKKRLEGIAESNRKWENNESFGPIYRREREYKPPTTNVDSDSLQGKPSWESVFDSKNKNSKGWKV